MSNAPASPLETVAANTLLAEGKTKRICASGTPNEVVAEFKDDATAFNAKKHVVVSGKGLLNATISRMLFEQVAQAGIPTCYLRPGSTPNALVYQSLTMIPLEVVVRNYAYGSLSKRFKLADGTPLSKPLVEFFHKTDDDPQITEDLILELGILKSQARINKLKRLALQINEVFVPYFAQRGIRCADFKLEFGINKAGELMLGDELSPDNFRLRDIQTGAVLDKDVFRLDLADLKETYETLLSRMEAAAADSASTLQAQSYAVEVFVESRANIFSPESKAIQDGLHTMGYDSLSGLSAGRRFTFKLSAPSLVEAERQVEAFTSSLLANPVIEDYRYEITPQQPVTVSETGK